MIKLFTLSVLITGSFITSIYSLLVPAVDENSNIKFNSFRNKTILIVNVATGSSSAGQLQQLQQLYLLHQDSLVIVAFPSNSFGNEPRQGNQLRQYMRDTLGLTFPIAYKSSVSDNNANSVFEWLRDKQSNEVTVAKCKTDFQKFLIDQRGQLVAVFDSAVSPLSTLMQSAIKNN